MAIDTRDRRASAMLEPEILPFPDGAISSGVDRGWALSFYSGITGITFGSVLDPVVIGGAIDSVSKNSYVDSVEKSGRLDSVGWDSGGRG